MQRYFLTGLLFLFSFVNLLAQKEDELAAQYYQAQEYEKAADLYEKLLKSNPTSPYYYENLMNSYIALKKFDDARDVAVSMSKKFKNGFYYKVDKGYTYRLEGKLKDAEKVYKDILKNFTPGFATSVELFNAFIKRDENDYAIQTVVMTRTSFNDQSIMSEELAALYYKMNNLDAMMDEYLNFYEVDPSPGKQTTKEGLITKIFDDSTWTVFKKKVFSKMQKTNGDEKFGDLYRWLLIQKREWDAAFIQYRAADKRLKANGKFVYEFALIAKENQAYNQAKEAYNYIVSLGNDGENRNYAPAKFGLAELNYLLLKSEINPDTSLAKSAEQNYLSILEEFGKNYHTAPSMMQLASVYLKYLHKPEKAIEYYELVGTIPNVNRELAANAKLFAGDSYLAMGNIWDAQLLYSQVDKDFKEDPIGREAKLRNAKLSYFKGDFTLAQAQLDILKTATSQLISNDAIELSLLIQENLTTEEFDSGLYMYANAELLMMQNLNKEALAMLDDIKMRYPTHTLNDEILLLKARIMKQSGDYSEAEKYYKKVFEEFKWDILSDNAMFELADLYEKKLNKPEEAKKLYEQLILEQEGSFYVTEARVRYRKLRGEISTPAPEPQNEF